MPRRPRLKFEGLTETLQEIFRRTWQNGLCSGWTCAKTHLLNLGVRLRRRFLNKLRVQCCCCGWQGPMFCYIDCGKLIVPGAECPHCFSHERQRMLKLYLDRFPPGFLSVSGGGVGFELRARRFHRAFHGAESRTSPVGYGH